VSVVPIIPTVRRESFDGPEWTFELKFDGFRGIADTLNGRMLSKRGNRMKRFERLLAALPAGCIFDGEIIAPDRTGRPVFADLMLRRGAPAYVAFDVLMADGEDLRPLPLVARKAVLKHLAKGARHWIAVTDGATGEGRRLFELVGEMDLEGIVAKRLGDPYAPGSTTWWKVLNRSYSQKEGRSELFERGFTIRAGHP
jgi:bifunctional non-homologous end joining protein LigD